MPWTDRVRRWSGCSHALTDPANLAWLSRMPMCNWDPFTIWTVSEGRVPFHTAMPSFKASLSGQDQWAVIA
jgi:hypothetical protein